MSKIHEIELLIPPTAVGATIRIIITPPTGAVLVYGAPFTEKPIKFHGPQQIGSVATKGQKIRVEMVDCTATWEIETIGWTDGI
jgi:RecB family endonuclease NucS